MKAVHVITSTHTGGAEVMLLRLLQQLQQDPAAGYDPYVISLLEPGAISAQIEALGIPVESLSARRGVPTPTMVGRLARIMRRERPVVVQTWMYHADLIGGLAARVAGNIPVAWGLHHSNLSPSFNKRSTLLTARACAHASRWLPSAIVCCAESTRKLHREFGYDADKLMVIPNGFDLDIFRPDPEAPASVRRELGIPETTRLIGVAARFHPQKDHETFVKAAEQIAATREDTHFLLCGDLVTWDNEELVGWIDAAGIRDRFHLLGRRRDLGRIQASLDVACLSSQGGEAMPLTIGEAMASGVPCVVTNVGDAARLVGDTGRIVPTRDPAAMAEACLAMLSLPLIDHARLGVAARRRISENYSLPMIADRYLALHEQLAQKEFLCAA
jgi:glycosyltransferase involved in cell wall biosynthesis